MASSIVTVYLTPSELQVMNAALKTYISAVELMTRAPVTWAHIKVKDQLELDLGPTAGEPRLAIVKANEIKRGLGLT